MADRALLGCNDFRDTLDALLEDALDRIRDGHLRHGTTGASALKFDGDDTGVIDADELDIATIRLQGGTDEVDDLDNL
jgi:hypothetical protein